MSNVWRVAAAAGVIAALALIVSAEGPRTAVLTIVAGAAVCATRTRSAPFVAAGVVVATALVLLGGSGISR